MRQEFVFKNFHALVVDLLARPKPKCVDEGLLRKPLRRKSEAVAPPNRRQGLVKRLLAPWIASHEDIQRECLPGS